MSQPPPSYPVPSGYPIGQPPRPAKYRPSGWWFAVGAGLLVAALAAGVGLFIWTLSAFLSVDATVDADGQSHRVSVETDGDRMLWRGDDDANPDCLVVDTATGQSIELRPVTGRFTKDVGDGSWTGAYRFDPGSGDLEVTCASTPGINSDGDPEFGNDEEVQIGPAPSVGGFVGGLVATVAVPSLLGLLGLATLIVTGILWGTRPARPKG